MNSHHNVDIKHLISLSWQQWRHNFAEADNRILRYCQLILMTSLICLSVSSASMQQVLQHNLQNLLGADLIVSQSQPLPSESQSYLGQSAQDSSRSTLHSITLSHKEYWQNAQLKAVDQFYPVQGEVKIASSLLGESIGSPSGPRTNEIWLDERLIRELHIEIGETLQIKGHEFVVQAVLKHEPDRLLEGHSVAMRAMISAESNLVEELLASPTQFRYAFNMPSNRVMQVTEWLKDSHPQALVMHQQSGHPLASFWKRVENFLGLIMVVLFMMAAITLNMAGKRKQEKEQFRSSLFLALGLNNKHTVMMSITEFGFNFLILLLPAFALAAIGQYFFLETVTAEMIGANLQYSLWQPLALGKSILLLSILLLMFQIPNWFALMKLSPAKLLKQQTNTNKNPLFMLLSLAVLACLALFYSDNPLLTMMVLGGILASVVLMLFVTWLLLFFAGKTSHYLTGPMGVALYLLRQRFTSKATEIIGLGMSLMLMLFCLMLLKDFGDMLGKYTRSHDGNLMITQANSEQANKLRDWAKQNDAQVRQLRPYYLAKLLTINGKTVEDFVSHPSEASAAVVSEIRMHYTNAIPQNNRVAHGEWWENNTNAWQQVSVEEEVMTDLGLSIGDKLKFQTGPSQHEFEIVSTHVYRGGAGAITFWFQVPDSFSDVTLGTELFMGSMELPEQSWSKLGEVWQAMPSLRMVSLQEMTDRFDNSLSILTKGISIFSGLILLMTLLVAAASVQSYLKQDKAKNGLMLSFGHSKMDCVKLSALDWFLTGVITVVGAIGGTLIIGNLIYKSQFSMTYQPNFVWLFGVLFITISFITIAGLLLNRESLNMSVRQLLLED